jgi:alpha-2-macroglobulin
MLVKYYILALEKFKLKNQQHIMKTNKIVSILLAVLVLFNACKNKSGAEFNSDFALYKEFITSFSAGFTSVHSDIRVQLAFNKSDWKPNQELDEDLFEISPSVKGKVIALSTNTIAFVPATKLEQNQEYKVSLKLADIIKTPKELANFNFTIKTIKQDFVVVTHDMQSYSKDWAYLNCALKTADDMSFDDALKIIEATHLNEKLAVKFDKNASTPTEFKFIIDSIKVIDDDSFIAIKWDGNNAGIDQKGAIQFPIAGRNNFKVIRMEVDETNNQLLLINFSEPLKKEQDFSGLITVEQAANLRFMTNGNLLKVMFEEPLTGNLLVEAFEGIESEYGLKLKKTYAEKVSFEQTNPGVKLIKNGTLLPSSNNLKINFEAANVSAVDVKVYKIYKDNILQFLQDNELNGGRNLKQVAQTIAQKTIDLKQNNILNYSKWNTYALDLSTLITPEPGAIYRVEFSIKKQYSLYKCTSEQANEDDNNSNKEDEEPINENDVNYSGSYDDYYYEGDYDYNDREDPCSNYYYYNAKVATNVLATDLGVIVKRGENKSYFVAVSNIVTTNAEEGALVDLYNYQQQKIASATTGNDGSISFELDKFAYFAVVTKDKSTTYVKLDDATALSTSNFDVAGATLQKGLKGYIYGERGVWRPGDSLYLSFILNDNANKLPTSHPIKIKLSDPNGKAVYQTTQKSNDLNHYKFVVPTVPDAPTGSWEAVVSVGGARFYKNIKIETIKPNRLKIRNSFGDKVLSSSKNNTNNLQVTWMHGAVAKDLTTEVQAKFAQQVTGFKGFDSYVFDDPTREFTTEEVNIYSGKIDDNGKAAITINPSLKGVAPGILKATFITKVYENGGDVSTDVATTTYSPYPVYVGLKEPDGNKYGMLETNKSNGFEIAAVDENGKSRANVQVDVKIYKMESRWWWDATSDNMSNYQTSTTKTPYKNFSTITNAKGKTDVQFTVANEDYGRYLVRVSDAKGGHSSAITVYVDQPYGYYNEQPENGDAANKLMFAADKTKYNVGEKATVFFPSSEGGRALISIENGTKVVQTLWAKTQKGETKVELPITPAMAPNVFIHITLLQPHASTINDLPIRMYGVIPIEVVDKNTVLQPVITMPTVLKPEQTTTVKVSEEQGKAMTYTIAIVDEGLLDLTRFKTPNAWNDFYSREALGVRTWDVYDNVIGAYGGKVNQIFSIGGDQELGGGSAKKANRFKPVVIYLGPFTLAKGQSKTHQIKLPNYIGSVKTMVVAADASISAYGCAEKITPVRNPLMVLASLPRKISPAEKVTIPVTVFAMENHVKNVSVVIKTNNMVKVLSPTTQALNFATPDEKMMYFDLEVGSITGLGKVQIIATSGKERAVYDVEIDVTNPNPVTHQFKDTIIELNASKTINWKAFGVNGSNTAKLEVSSIPTIDFNRRLDYLIQYPHGCVEQTTSSVFPQLYLTDVMDIDAIRTKNMQVNINAGIARLAGFQLSTGGMSYWQGGNTPDDWGTSYSGHFLIEAEKKGYVLPVNFKQKWIAFQLKQAKQWRYEQSFGNDMAQAYRLYTLALAGAQDVASMNRLRETVAISNECKLRLAATYALIKQNNVGVTLLNTCKIDESYTSSNYYYYYGSAERNRAMYVETLLLLGKKQQAFAQAIKLAKELSSNQWMSTQTTAYGLYAMSKFVQSNGSKGVNVTYTSGGVAQQIKTNKAIADRKLIVNGANNAVTIKNNNNGTVFVRVLTSGILPVGTEQVAQNNISTKTVFKDRKGNTINVGSIAQGTEFIAEVTLTNLSNENVSNVALSQILPSGFEIVNTRYADTDDGFKNDVDYMDLRDDCANYYFSINAGKTKVFKLALNASYLGKYYLPGTQVEAMYDNNYLSRTKGQWIEIVR